MIIRQLSVGHMDNFCYIVGCESTGEAMVIDPGADVEKILETARREGLTITTIFNTHHHWDHIAGNGALKAATGAQLVRHALEDDIVKQEAAGRKASGADIPTADRRIEGDDMLTVGQITFKVISTPGHSPGGLCLYADGQLFTGDTLFVGDSGRTDLPGGHRPTLGASIRRLMELPDDTAIWPGHDYGPSQTSTIYNEKRTNVNAKEYGYYEGS